MWLSLVFALSVACCVSGGKLNEVYSWKVIDFAWPSHAVRDAAIKSGQYIPENNLAASVERWHDKLFVMLPRMKVGVPVTLAYIPLNETDGHEASPALIPYPNLKDNMLPEYLPEYHKYCGEPQVHDSQLISVFRVRVDKHDRLWVLDTGIVKLFQESQIRVVKPALLIYDLETDTLIRRYTLKDSDYNDNSNFIHLALDSRDKGDTIAYVSDLHGYGLVVYSFDQNDSWRIEHNYFHNDPLAGEYNVGGIQFYWLDGVCSFALSPVNPDGSRTAYFHPGSSTKQFAVSSKVLSNATYANSPEAFHEFKLIGDRGPRSQTTTSWLDEETGVIFYTEVNKNSITCWNIMKPDIENNMGLVVSDHDKLLFPEEIMMDNERNMWIVSDKVPQFMYKTLNPLEVNFRIFRVKVDEAITGTVCDVPCNT